MSFNIFEYTCYRKLLNEYYKIEKEKNPSFSHRFFAKRAGISSPSLLLMIANGNRNISKDSVTKFANAMKLSKKERQYFETLVAFNHAKSVEAKTYYLEILNTLSKTKPGKYLSNEQYEYISSWYYPAIRELVSLPFFQEDPNWIRKTLKNKVTLFQVKDALEKLERLGLIKRDENGRLAQTDELVMTENEVMHTASCVFHTQMLTLAKEAACAIHDKKRKISGMTMAISKKQYDEIAKKIHEFEKEIFNYLDCNKESPESVFQLNIQLFSLTN